jgi:aminomethyltransferase
VNVVLRPTPFHPRTSALCGSFQWKDWNGYAAVCNFDAHSEQEYFAFRNKAGLIDVSPLRKYEIRGPDGGRLMSRVMSRDVEKFGVGRVTYCALIDEDGKILDDCTVGRIGKEHWRMTSSEPWLHWLRRHGRGLDVQLEDSSASLCALALQGPNAREILKPITAFDMDRMRFFRIRTTQLAGKEVQISRTGYTGDLGYEIWIQPQDALHVWDALMEAGHDHGITPCGLDALDVVRIEAGFVLGGIDYICSRQCLIEIRKSSPDECGLDWAVDLEGRQTRFVGQEAIERERREGSTWAFVGLDIDWEHLEALYAEYNLPPHLAPVACRDPVPIYSADGRKQVGQVTSTTWSPLLKRYIALGQVYAPWGEVGTELRVEHTVDFNRRQLPCLVVKRPFYDPPRKRFTPASAKKVAK